MQDHDIDQLIHRLVPVLARELSNGLRELSSVRAPSSIIAPSPRIPDISQAVYRASPSPPPPMTARYMASSTSSVSSIRSYECISPPSFSGNTRLGTTVRSNDSRSASPIDPSSYECVSPQRLARSIDRRISPCYSRTPSINHRDIRSPEYPPARTESSSPPGLFGPRSPTTFIVPGSPARSESSSSPGLFGPRSPMLPPIILDHDRFPEHPPISEPSSPVGLVQVLFPEHSPSEGHALLQKVFGRRSPVTALDLASILCAVEKPPVIPMIKHNRFYFPDGTIVFLVENTLFKVYRGLFFERDSEHFKNLLARNEFSRDAPPEDRPIVLEDCTVVDFERFLSVLYPASFDEHTATTLEEWTSILALSTQWSFATIRALAIRSLFPLASPVDKLVLGHKYAITEWLKDAYTAVCERAEPLTDEEAERLGLKEVAAIARVREGMRVGWSLIGESKVDSLIEDTFSLGVVPHSPTRTASPLGSNDQIQKGVSAADEMPMEVQGNPPQADCGEGSAPKEYTDNSLDAVASPTRQSWTLAGSAISSINESQCIWTLEPGQIIRVTTSKRKYGKKKYSMIQVSDICISDP